MKFDFSSFPMSDGGFSRRPMTILDGEAKSLFGVIVDIALLETGSRKARADWQETQWRNLLRHATDRSAFWRTRLAGKNPANVTLAELPVLTRGDLSAQVAAEGSLVAGMVNVRSKPHSTSGSSGRPARFFVSEINVQYNRARWLAQYFIEGRDLTLNRTRLRMATKPGLSVREAPSWLEALVTVFRGGRVRQIDCLRPDLGELVQVMTSAPIGYLAAAPWFLEMLSASVDLDFLRRGETAMWIAYGSLVTNELAQRFDALGIPVRSTYSAEEASALAFECPTHRGHFHVASSNVILEAVEPFYDVGGERMGRILMTHLHSYATPFIRYDIGDLGRVAERCPCGHDGPTLTALYGRLGSTLHHRDGRRTPLQIRSGELMPMAEFTEYRIRQTDFEKLVVEIGGRTELRDKEIERLTGFFRDRVGDTFSIDIKPCAEIDWGESVKRLGFRSEV